MAGEKILIADDNTQIRMLVKAALMADGYQLVEAADGEDALQKAIDEQPDLVLLDVTMQKLDGFEVLQFMYKRPDNAYFPQLLAHAKLASAVLSLALFLLQGHYLVFLANAVIDGGIGALVAGLYFSRRRQGQWACC